MSIISRDTATLKVKKWVILGALFVLAAAALCPFVLRYTFVRAVQGADANTVKMLLKIGVNANTTDYDGRPAIVQAVDYYQRADIVTLLLNHGANVNATDEEQRTPLIHAVEDSHRSSPDRSPEICRLLIAHGTNMNAKDYHDQTALIHAAIKQDYPMVQLLLSHGADASIKDGYFSTASDYIALFDSSNFSLIKQLQEAARKKPAIPPAS